MRTSGVGQLTLLEHALCPLDPMQSLKPGLMHTVQSPAPGRGRQGQAQILAPLGLSAHDELVLWGLLALTLAQPGDGHQLHASQSYCLQHLGLWHRGTSVGGKNYADFRMAIQRLSAATYCNDRFYHPIRREHRQVTLRFFTYDLPEDPKSSRAWQFTWDTEFLKICRQVGGALTFDLPTYQQLDCASRRLYLLLHKIFWRKPVSPRFDVRELATNVLGYSQNLPMKTLNARVDACAKKLFQNMTLELPPGFAHVRQLRERQDKGRYIVRFFRGEHFTAVNRMPKSVSHCDSALAELLRSIGFENPAVAQILRSYGGSQVATWIDVTLAARERFGENYFRQSACAFFIDSIRAAQQGGRTVPDWYSELARERERRADDKAKQCLNRIAESLAADKGDSRPDSSETSPKADLPQPVSVILQAGNRG